MYAPSDKKNIVSLFSQHIKQKFVYPCMRVLRLVSFKTRETRIYRQAMDFQEYPNASVPLHDVCHFINFKKIIELNKDIVPCPFFSVFYEDIVLFLVFINIIHTNFSSSLKMIFFECSKTTEYHDKCMLSNVKRIFLFTFS